MLPTHRVKQKCKSRFDMETAVYPIVKSNFINMKEGFGMQAAKELWDFLQTELLGMNWLNRLIGRMVEACGFSPVGRIGGSIRFFLYDTIKIMVLLGVLILIISYIQRYFPPERAKKNSRRIPRDRRQHPRRAPGHGHTLLLLLVDPVIHRLYQRRTSPRRHIFFSDFFSNG